MIIMFKKYYRLRFLITSYKGVPTIYTTYSELTVSVPFYASISTAIDKALSIVGNDAEFRSFERVKSTSAAF